VELLSLDPAGDHPVFGPGAACALRLRWSKSAPRQAFALRARRSVCVAHPASCGSRTRWRVRWRSRPPASTGFEASVSCRLTGVNLLHWVPFAGR